MTLVRVGQDLISDEEISAETSGKIPWRTIARLQCACFRARTRRSAALRRFKGKKPSVFRFFNISKNFDSAVRDGMNAALLRFLESAVGGRAARGFTLADGRPNMHKWKGPQR